MTEELRSGDTLVVLTFDRAFRSFIDGLVALNDLTDRGIKLESTSQCFDQTTPDGRLLFTLTKAIGEWEVNKLTVIRMKGLKAAITRGEKLGRPRKCKG